jgi:hypothetical protein
VPATNDQITKSDLTNHYGKAAARRHLLGR